MATYALCYDSVLVRVELVVHSVCLKCILVRLLVRQRKQGQRVTSEDIENTLCISSWIYHAYPTPQSIPTDVLDATGDREQAFSLTEQHQ